MGSNPWRFHDSLESNQLRRRYKLPIASSSLAYIWNVISGSKSRFPKCGYTGGPGVLQYIIWCIAAFDISPHPCKDHSHVKRYVMVTAQLEELWSPTSYLSSMQSAFRCDDILTTIVFTVPEMPPDRILRPKRITTASPGFAIALTDAWRTNGSICQLKLWKEK